MEVSLIAKSRKGKNRLAELKAADASFDGSWKVMETRDAVQFVAGKRGPWHMIKPNHVDETIAEKFMRWVHESDDEHFSLTML